MGSFLPALAGRSRSVISTIPDECHGFLFVYETSVEEELLMNKWEFTRIDLPEYYVLFFYEVIYVWIMDLREKPWRMHGFQHGFTS